MTDDLDRRDPAWTPRRDGDRAVASGAKRRCGASRASPEHERCICSATRSRTRPIGLGGGVYRSFCLNAAAARAGRRSSPTSSVVNAGELESASRGAETALSRSRSVPRAPFCSRTGTRSRVPHPPLVADGTAAGEAITACRSVSLLGAEGLEDALERELRRDLPHRGWRAGVANARRDRAILPSRASSISATSTLRRDDAVALLDPVAKDAWSTPSASRGDGHPPGLAEPVPVGSAPRSRGRAMRLHELHGDPVPRRVAAEEDEDSSSVPWRRSSPQG